MQCERDFQPWVPGHLISEADGHPWAEAHLDLAERKVVRMADWIIKTMLEGNFKAH